MMTTTSNDQVHDAHLPAFLGAKAPTTACVNASIRACCVVCRCVASYPIVVISLSVSTAFSRTRDSILLHFTFSRFASWKLIFVRASRPKPSARLGDEGVPAPPSQPPYTSALLHRPRSPALLAPPGPVLRIVEHEAGRAEGNDTSRDRGAYNNIRRRVRVGSGRRRQLSNRTTRNGGASTRPPPTLLPPALSMIALRLSPLPLPEPYTS